MQQNQGFGVAIQKSHVTPKTKVLIGQIFDKSNSVNSDSYQFCLEEWAKIPAIHRMDIQNDSLKGNSTKH